MPEYSYDQDDYRFQDDRPYYDFDEREWITNSEARTRSTELSDRPSSKPWWIELGVDMPDASPRSRQRRPSRAQQDPNDDDMSRLQLIYPQTNSLALQLPIDFFLYPYVYRNSEWPAWTS